MLSNYVLGPDAAFAVFESHAERLAVSLLSLWEILTLLSVAICLAQNALCNL